MVLLFTFAGVSEYLLAHTDERAGFQLVERLLQFGLDHVDGELVVDLSELFAQDGSVSFLNSAGHDLVYELHHIVYDEYVVGSGQGVSEN